MVVITEFIRSHFKPETAREAYGVVGDGFRTEIAKAPGLISYRMGLILKENDVDVSDKYSAITGLEWENPEAFHAFFPASPKFQEFIKTVMPYASQKAVPQLFNPSSGYDRSAQILDTGLTQLFTGPVGVERKEEVEGAWKLLLETLEKEGVSEHWSGWGIEDAEGTWSGVVAWKDSETLASVTKKNSVAGALGKLRAIEGVNEMIVQFEH